MNTLALHIGSGNGASPIATIAVILLVLFVVHKVSVDYEKEDARRKEEIRKFKEEHPGEEPPIEPLKDELLRTFVEHAVKSIKSIK
ncbi:MAG: hypothetical protein K5851_01445 [Lachnospiraceae bacterium]|nr:hypothetical protein [Lachnospiraceae bacterium]